MQWLKEVQMFLPQSAQMLLSGNIYDSFFYETPEGQKIPLPLKDLLGRFLVEREEYHCVISYTPLQGFSHVFGSKEASSEAAGKAVDKNEANTLERDFETIQKIIKNQKYHAALIIDFASRLKDIAERDLGTFLYKMLKEAVYAKRVKAGDSIKFNTVFYLLDREGDFPSWFFIERPNVKSILIQKPEMKARREAVSQLVKMLDGFDPSQEENLVREITDRTHGMLIREIISVFQIAKQNGIKAQNVSDAIRAFRTGIKENPWEAVDREKIKNAESIIEERVKGQPQAVKKASQIIKRAFFNLSGSQFNVYSQKPKGILFFAGPTGVGKTELAKTIAQLIFGTEDALNPFSVILFDEIEKAHPRVLDIMLQLLDEGVLTSGRGEKAFFSECLIVFTSNLGASEVTPSMDYSQIEKRMKEAIENYFVQINRPEILNRIGKNIVIFDFIRKETGEKIARIMIERVVKKMEKEKGIKIQIEKEAVGKIVEKATSDLSMGGRGIGNALEEVFINPLSELLFEIEAKKGDTVKLSFDETLKGEISGGEPFDQADELKTFLTHLRKKEVEDIIIYSGYCQEKILSSFPWIKGLAGLLISEPFVWNLESSYGWKGSENQKALILNEKLKSFYAEFLEKREKNYQIIDGIFVGIPSRKQLLKLYNLQLVK